MLLGDLQDDSVRVICSLRPMDMPPRSFDFFFEPRQIYVHIFDRVQADLRPDLAEFLPLRQFRDSSSTPRQKAIRRLLHRGGNAGRHVFTVFFKANVGRDFVTHTADSLDANRSMICMARIFDPALYNPPATFIKHPGSHMTTVSAPLARISLILF